MIGKPIEESQVRRPFDPINRAEEYRVRAEQARTQGEAMENGTARDSMLQAAATWDRMARFEEEQERKQRPSN
jgi:hypothetical protein